MACPNGSAHFSACGRYRYLLTRRFNDDELAANVATFIMLNPSTADATRNDPTIRKCIGFAQRWQCDMLQVLNLFAIRATYPHEMKRESEPVGTENLGWFAHALTPKAASSHLVICAWGVHGAHLGQDRFIHQWLIESGVKPFALGFTKQGHPRHPLYLPYSTGLVAYL